MVVVFGSCCWFSLSESDWLLLLVFLLFWVEYRFVIPSVIIGSVYVTPFSRLICRLIVVNT